MTGSRSTENMTNQVSPGSATGPAPLLPRLLATSAGSSATLARVVLAAVMFPHGAQKVLGWFGGFGFANTLAFFTHQMGLPSLVAVMVILIEFVAPLLLLAGLATRLAALGIGAVMIGAVATVHVPFGFFMNWTGAQGGEGFEYHLLVLGFVILLLVQGGGSFSLDRRLAAAD